MFFPSLRYTVHRQLNRQRKEVAPIYFITTYAAHKGVIADLTRTLQVLEGVKSSHVHLVLVEIVEGAEKRRKGRINLSRLFARHPTIGVTQGAEKFRMTSKK